MLTWIQNNSRCALTLIRNESRAFVYMYLVHMHLYLTAPHKINITVFKET